jgi:hypothetical protein
MDINYFISSLEDSVKKIESYLRGVSNEQAQWKPRPEKWSILEVVNHLYDEEQYDFRKRIDLILHTPDKDWPPIDPEGWVKDHEYYKKDYQLSVKNFILERNKSLEWLSTLSKPDWDQTYLHPIIGPLKAGDLLASWATHDFLHLRQLSDLRAQYLNILARPYSTKYASP